MAAGLEVDGEDAHPLLAAREGEIHPVPVAALRIPFNDIGVPFNPPAGGPANDDRRALGPFRIGVTARKEELPIRLREDPAGGGGVLDFLEADDLDAEVREPRHDTPEPFEIGLPAQVLAAAAIADEDLVSDSVAEPGDVPGGHGQVRGRLGRRTGAQHSGREEDPGKYGTPPTAGVGPGTRPELHCKAGYSGGTGRFPSSLRGWVMGVSRQDGLCHGSAIVEHY